MASTKKRGGTTVSTHGQKLSRSFTNAQRENIEAVELLVSYLRTALGPRGSYKMLLEKSNFVRPVLVSKDGYEILNRMEVAHPAAKILADASKWVDHTIADGSLSVVVLTGVLLGKAKDSIARGLHPTTVADGYAISERKVQEFMEELAFQFDTKNEEHLLNLARSCLETKISFEESDFLAPLVVRAAQRVRESTHRKHDEIDPDHVNVVKKTGGTIFDSELIEGIVLYREPTSGTMPREVYNARIALINEKLEIRKTIQTPQIEITSPAMLGKFREAEKQMLMEKLEKILATGANVIISQESYDDYLQITLGRMGIMAIRRAQKIDIEKLARATGGKIQPDISAISSSDLGEAKHIFVRKMERENWLSVEGCKDPRSVTLLVRGSNSNIVESAAGGVRSALRSLERVLQEPRYFPGGGSLEAELAHRLRKWAYSLEKRAHLAVLKYAEALESIPMTLAQSCGLDPLDSMIEIRKEHDRGNTWFGVEVRNRRLADMKDSGVVDLLAVKSKVFGVANEVAELMITVDHVFTQPKWNPPRIPEGPASHRVTPNQRVPGFEYGEAKKFLPETW